MCGAADGCRVLCFYLSISDAMVAWEQKKESNLRVYVFEEDEDMRKCRVNGGNKDRDLL